MDIDPNILDPENKHLSYQEYLKRYLRCVKNPGHYGIRTKDYKLIFFYGKFWKDAKVEKDIEGWGSRYGFVTPAAWELYDLKNDPQEMQNEYANPNTKQLLLI